RSKCPLTIATPMRCREAGTLDIATREQARTIYDALRQQGRRRNADSEQEAPRSPHDCFPPRESTTRDALDAPRIRLLRKPSTNRPPVARWRSDCVRRA